MRPNGSTAPQKRIQLRIPEELHRRLKIRAAANQTSLQALVTEALEALVEKPEMSPPVPILSSMERAARVDAAVGALSHVPGSVDEYLKRKQEDIALEEERDARRWSADRK